jgi:hypothetical protein
MGRKKHKSAWTVDILKEHFDRVIAEKDQQYKQRFDAQETSTHKAETSLMGRLASMNEIREQLNQQAMTFMPRSESEQRFHAVGEKLETITETFTGLTNTHFESNGERLRELESWRSQQAGVIQHSEKSGTFNMWIISTIFAAAVAIASIVMLLAPQVKR